MANTIRLNIAFSYFKFQFYSIDARMLINLHILIALNQTLRHGFCGFRIYSLNLLLHMVRITLLLLVITMASAQQGHANRENNDEAIVSYIERYKDIAVNEMARTGIPASIKLAQAVLESNAGRSYLATQGNNHFGIKCGKYWQGRTVKREDDDYKNGKLIKSCFRAFPSVAVSYKAHSEFLLDPRKDYRYGFLFDLPETDYHAWAYGLKKAGYATNPKYPTQLISIIERYFLNQYDELGLIAATNQEINKTVIASEPPKNTPPESTYVEPETTVNPEATVNIPAEKPVVVAANEPNPVPAKTTETFFAGEARSYQIRQFNNVDYVKTEQGDQLSEIAMELGLNVQELIEYNEYSYGPDQPLPEDAHVYLEQKRSKFSGSRETYRASKGETALQISQKFGIRLKKLRKRNDWDDGYNPRGGELVYLRGRK